MQKVTTMHALLSKQALCFLFVIAWRSPSPPLFPYTTLFRSVGGTGVTTGQQPTTTRAVQGLAPGGLGEALVDDRKSTRLYPSHFCNSDRVIHFNNILSVCEK